MPATATATAADAAPCGRLCGDGVAAALTWVHPPVAGDLAEDVAALLTGAQVTGEHMRVIAALEGARLGPRHREDPAGHPERVLGAWRGLAEMVATGASVEVVRAWRACGLGDEAAEVLRRTLDLAVVAQCAALDPDLPEVLPGYLAHTRPCGIPDAELPGWVRAGLIRSDVLAVGAAVEQAWLWRRHLGAAGVRWASAGVPLAEALALADGPHRAQDGALEVLGALVGPLPGAA